MKLLFFKSHLFESRDSKVDYLDSEASTTDDDASDPSGSRKLDFANW